MEYFAQHAKDIMFPPESIQQPVAPPSVPITQLLGSYTHPSYGTIKLKQCDGQATLQGSFPGRLPLDPLTLEHIEGDSFLARADLVQLIPVRAKATFIQDATGCQLKLGIDFSEGLTTWFEYNGDM